MKCMRSFAPNPTVKVHCNNLVTGIVRHINIFHMYINSWFQSGKSQGLSGTIGGIADSYMAKSKAKSLDAKLAKGTKWVGAVFIVLTLVINCMLAAAA